MRTAALTLGSVCVQGQQGKGLQSDIWVGLGSLWVQEMGCGAGWGREKRMSSAERTEQASTQSTGMLRELQIVFCGRSVWLVGRGHQESGKGLASCGRGFGLFLQPVRRH